MGKKFKEKFDEQHEIKNRIIIWYVRAVLEEREKKNEYLKLKSILDNWENQLSNTDKYIASLILNGADLDKLNIDYRTLIEKETGFSVDTLGL